MRAAQDPKIRAETLEILNARGAPSTRVCTALKTRWQLSRGITHEVLVRKHASLWARHRYRDIRMSIALPAFRCHDSSSWTFWWVVQLKEGGLVLNGERAIPELVFVIENLVASL